jgi:hypothetical protein
MRFTSCTLQHRTVQIPSGVSGEVFADDDFTVTVEATPAGHQILIAGNCRTALFSLDGKAFPATRHPEHIELTLPSEHAEVQLDIAVA